MSDKVTTLLVLKKIISKFRDDRDWGKFHDPKNLAEAISIEAAELQELFLWRDSKDVVKKIKKVLINKIVNMIKPWEKINEDVIKVGFRSLAKRIFKLPDGREEEFADIMIFAINFANAVKIDVSKVVKEKIDKNNKKYPVEKAKGRADKYNKL